MKIPKKVLLAVTVLSLCYNSVYATDFIDGEDTTLSDDNDELFQDSVDNTNDAFSAEAEISYGDKVVENGIIYEYMKSRYEDVYKVVGHTEELKEESEIKIAEYVNGKWVGEMEGGCFSDLDKVQSISIPGSITVIYDSLSDYRNDIVIKCPERSAASDAAGVCCLKQDHSGFPPEVLYTDNAGGYILCRNEDLTRYYAVCVWGKMTEDKLYDIQYYSEIAGIPVTFLTSASNDGIDMEYFISTGSDYRVLKVQSFQIPASIQKIGTYEFSKYGYYDWAGDEKGYENLKSVIFDDGDTEIELGDHLFGQCPALTEVIFSSRVKKLPDYTFVDCPALTHLNLPDGLTEIGKASFQGAVNLEALHIPSTVTAIAEDAMDGLSNLVIWGKEGSYAQTYANAHNIAFCNLEDDAALPETAIGRVSLNKDSVVLGENKLSISIGQKLNSADGYTYVISKDPQCIQNGNYLQVKNTANQTVTFNMSKLNGGTYYVACRAWKRIDGTKVNGSWSTVQKIKVTAKSLKKSAAPLIKSVKVKGSTVTVTLYTSTFAKASQCFVGTVKNDNGPLKIKYSSKKIKTKTRTITFKNVKKGTYYIGARSYTLYKGKANYSSWSETKKIKVK